MFIVKIVETVTGKLSIRLNNVGEQQIKIEDQWRESHVTFKAIAEELVMAAKLSLSPYDGSPKKFTQDGVDKDGAYVIYGSFDGRFADDVRTLIISFGRRGHTINYTIPLQGRHIIQLVDVLENFWN